MQVIVLHRELHDSKPRIRRARDALLDDTEDRRAAQRR
jgi:hypothetical protein